MDFKRILVPINGDSADEEAINLARDFANKSKGSLFILYIVEVPWKLPLDAEMNLEVRKAEAVLDYGESIAKKGNSIVQTEVLQARGVGTAVVKAALDHRVDLVVMNTLYERRFGDYTLGNTAPYVLENAPCHVWLCRGPRSVSE